jgi:hypothetical protein
VQYHLIDSLEPEQLAECEDALVGDYLAALARHGAVLDPALARAQYRALSFQTLVVALVSLGLGGLTEREDTVRTVLRRASPPWSGSPSRTGSPGSDPRRTQRR